MGVIMRRSIMLVDMNAFFISCETVRNPELRGRPAAVAGDPKNRSGIILTANYEARKYGVKTTMLLHQARKLCPDIIFVPPDHGYYRKMSDMVMELLYSYSPVIEQNSIDEAWLDVTGCEAIFGKPRQMAESIMDSIESKLGLCCSIGISENKFLAKMASNFKKPLGITEIRRDEVEERIWPLPVREMYGIGKRTEKKLYDMGIYTIGDIAGCDKKVLTAPFGKYGEEIYLLATGIDNSAVKSNYDAKNKSISRSSTLPSDITDVKHALPVLMELAEQVAAEARRCGYRGETVSIEIKYGDFKSITRQKAVRPTCLTTDIYGTGSLLLKRNWSNKPVRLLGISLGNLSAKANEQLSIFTDFGYGAHDAREEKLERTVDALREKFGYEKIRRANTFNKANPDQDRI